MHIYTHINTHACVHVCVCVCVCVLFPIQVPGSQSMDPRPAASASPGNLTKMQIFCPSSPRPTDSKALG